MILQKDSSIKTLSHYRCIVSKYFIEEDRYTGRQFMLFFKLLDKYYGGLYTIGIVLGLTMLNMVCFYYAIVRLYDAIEQQAIIADSVTKEMMIYIVLNVLPNLTIFLRLYVIYRVSLRTSRSIHNMMVIRSLHADLLSFYDKIQIGRLQNRFSNDI